MSLQRVTFHHVYPPYYPGDVAGLSATLAANLRARGIVSYDDPKDEPDFAAMDRAALVAYGRLHHGLVDEPPAEVSDDDLREALGGAVPPGLPDGTQATWDQLESMDRVHLEAFARTKCRMDVIDADLTDVELRSQIRAVAAASLSDGAVATQPETVPVRRRRP